MNTFSNESAIYPYPQWLWVNKENARWVDPSVQAVSQQVNVKSSPGGRLSLLSTRPAITFPAEERHHPSTSTMSYRLVTEAHRCEQLAQGCYAALSWLELNPWPIDRKSNALPLRHCATLLDVAVCEILRIHTSFHSRLLTTTICDLTYSFLFCWLLKMYKALTDYHRYT